MRLLYDGLNLRSRLKVQTEAHIAGLQINILNFWKTDPPPPSPLTPSLFLIINCTCLSDWTWIQSVEKIACILFANIHAQQYFRVASLASIGQMIPNTGEVFFSFSFCLTEQTGFPGLWLSSQNVVISVHIAVLCSAQSSSSLRVNPRKPYRNNIPGESRKFPGHFK